jgi:hypothetical protein
MTPAVEKPAPAHAEPCSPATRWLRFAVGLICLSMAVTFFASGYTPPGPFGEVLRHNQANEIDASPLLYSEVEHMAQLEMGVQKMMARARLKNQTLSEPEDH